VEDAAAHTENKDNPALAQKNKAAIGDKYEVQRTRSFGYLLSQRKTSSNLPLVFAYAVCI
jgi:hypothetical protein